ncbi:uncharacterized protein [Narcine bancroftii]|uniref:uncharacterized protein n=1 Tax=Narcine bancroftii TaxID=1343680 RepID=UPI003831FE33
MRSEVACPRPGAPVSEETSAAMTLNADRAFVLHGVRSALRKGPNEHLTNTQKTFTMQQQVPSEPSEVWKFINSTTEKPADDTLGEVPLAGRQKDSPSIDELEQSLSKLKMQVKSLTSNLNPAFMPDDKTLGDLENNCRPISKNGDWPVLTNGTFQEENISGKADESEWFVRPRCLVQSLDRYPAFEDFGVPVRSISPLDRVVGLIGSELSSKNVTTSTVSPVDIAYKERLPVRVGASHVIGVRALLPPQIPIRLQSPERTRPPSVRDQSQTRRRFSNIRSRSLSPSPKRHNWQQSHPQPTKPVWRPNSVTANACGRPPPAIKRQIVGGKKMAFTRSSQSYSKLGAFNLISQPSLHQTLSDSLSSLRALDVASPSTQEISERFLQTLAEGDIRQSLVEMSPYEQELSHLRLQRLHVEEEFLLELQRQQELERLQGPQLKW